MQHHFDVDIAKEYGILEAVLLNHLYFWVQKNQAEKKAFRDGKYWSFYTIKAMKELFPYASGDSIKRALKKLRDAGLIEVGNFNANSFDRTNWYTLSEFAQSMVRNRTMDGANLPNGRCENAPCLNKDNEQDNEQDNKHRYYASEPLNDAFLMWLKYKKTDKKQPYRKTGLEMLIKKINKAVEEYGEAEVIRSIEESIANGWAGLFFGKNQKKGEARIDTSKTDLDDIF